jgi:molybdopterin-guanine dinucleotide biosynthesis protein MobB
MLPQDKGRIVGVVGYKDSGKTRVVTGLVKLLIERGFKVGTIKHVHKGPEPRPAAKDSARHLDAGAAMTVVAGSGTTEVLGREGEDLEMLMARYLGLCDFVIVEGFKRADIPKIAVASEGEDIVADAEGICAVVGKAEKSGDLPAFTFDEIDNLAGFLLDEGILKKPDLQVSLMVDGEPVALNEFVQKSLVGVTKGFVSALRGVSEPAVIEIVIK